MVMPKSPTLNPVDARKLVRLTEKSKDANLTVEQRRDARKKRGVLMLSLRRAGWSLASIAEPINTTVSVVREQIIVNPPTTPSIEIYNRRGEKVTPDPLQSESDFGDMTEEEIRFLRGIAPMANSFNFSLGPQTPQYQASHLLDVALAFLYDKGRRPTDMAKAIATSNSLVRQRIRRGRVTSGTEHVKGQYKYPESIAKDVERMFSEIGPADAWR